MRKLKSISLLAAAAIVFAGGAGLVAQQTLAQVAASEAGPVTVATRRITETQYRNTIRDVFGPEVVINARFEPDKREEGLLAIGGRDLSITSSGFEQYFALAKSISDQVLDPKRRDATVGCKPADATKADSACARAFIEKYGEVLFRRPLTQAEVAARLKAADVGATQGDDFYAGLKLALSSLLVAPEFMFRVEVAEPDPANPRQQRLTGYTKAARLSHLFWDAAPDAELREAARSGAIHTKAGLEAQIARLTGSPRLQDGGRAFFVDMLQFDTFDSLTKDPTVYPKFNQAIADSAREQTLRTAVDLLIAKKRDYRELFTSNETFINRSLAAVYNVPYASAEPWSAYTFPRDSPRSGILTQITFLSLFSHPGASSPTKRGVKVHEIFMCEPTPEPPADVDFSKVQALDKGTVRVRLLDHMENEGCASCHERSDPPGLALEHFDGLGQIRTMENGTLIDVSAKLDGKRFSGATGLAKFLREDKRIPQCLVRNVYAYGVGRPTGGEDEDYLARQSRAFAKTGYRVPDMMAQVAASPEFFKVVVPAGARPQSVAPRVAAAQSSSGASQ